MKIDLTFHPKPLVLPAFPRVGDKFQLRRTVTPLRALLGQVGLVLALFLIVMTGILLVGFAAGIGGLIALDSFPA